MISFTSSGSFKNIEAFLNKMKRREMFDSIDALAREGVTALANATPVDSGVTAASWSYDIQRAGDSCTIVWNNTHVVDGRPIVIMLQYGHGTGTGGYVQGRDFINPAIKPVFDRIADKVWKAVTSA